jgi:pyruvate-formate lyase-activating enzyme
MTLNHPDTIPSMVYATATGEIKDLPDLEMAGRSGRNFVRPELEDLIPLPEGSDLFVLPGRLPVGFDPVTGEPLRVETDPDDSEGRIQAVAAFMAPAHTATLWAAFEKKDNALPPLPLFAYTAVGWHQGRFWACGFRSDPDSRQETDRHDQRKIIRRTRKRLEENPANRLIQHLGKCCLTYRCPAAVNYFMEAWEAPLPTSPICNAACVGCISLQPSGCCPSTQERIKFVPSPGEIADIAAPHLQKVKNGLASFGQGCEGEPLLQAATIEKAIQLIRKRTDRGTINLNSNASLPQAVEKLARAGLDSMRVSMNSARQDYHRRYYRPKGFDFDEVRQSIRIMKGLGKFVSLNYFILPGFTDDPQEFTALCDLLENYGPDFIQLRNLNMDPDWYLDAVRHQPEQEPMGIRNWLSRLQEGFPNLRFGYFNPPVR